MPFLYNSTSCFQNQREEGKKNGRGGEEGALTSSSSSEIKHLRLSCALMAFYCSSLMVAHWCFVREFAWNLKLGETQYLGRGFI